MTAEVGVFEVLESDVAVIDYVFDEFRLKTGECYASVAPGDVERRVMRRGHIYYPVPLEDTASESLRYPDFWISMKEDQAEKARVESIRATPVELSFDLPAGITERTAPVGDAARNFAVEYTYPFPRDIRVRGEDIAEGVAKAQAWFKATMAKAFADNPKADTLAWVIKPEADIQLCGDGRFKVKAYMRFAFENRSLNTEVASRIAASGRGLPQPMPEGFAVPITLEGDAIVARLGSRTLGVQISPGKTTEDMINAMKSINQTFHRWSEAERLGLNTEKESDHG